MRGSTADMKKLIAATLFVLACGGKSAPTTTATPSGGDTTDTTAAGGDTTAPSTGGKPEIGTWGFDTKGMNTKVAPGASFYEYANGTWLATT